MSLLNVAVFQSKNYGKIPKISPSKKKPPQTCNPKNLSLPRDLYLKIALKYKVKQRKMVNFLPRRRLGQSILKRKFPSLHKPWGLFSEFYGIRPHPSTRVGFCLKTDIPPPRFGPPSTRIWWKRSLKTDLFKNALQSGNFCRENTGFSFTCGRTKTEVFEYDDVIHHIESSMTHAP